MKTKRKILFTCITLPLGLSLINLMCWFLLPKPTVFWDNPLMMMYPVDEFDPQVTGDQMFRNDEPRRLVRYVSDRQRGFRLDPEPNIPEAGKLILHFGDSSTWGWGLCAQEFSYPGAVGQQLRGSVHSVNLGVPGYTSLQGRRYLESLLPTLDERVAGITLYFGNNDGTGNLTSDAQRIDNPSSALLRLVRGLAISRAWQVLINLLPTDHVEQPRVNPAEYAQHVRQMVAIARSYHVPVVLIMPPVHRTWPPVHLYPRPIKNWRPLADRVTNRWILRELQQAQISYARGLELLYRSSDDCELAFAEAVEHDWVLPRMKTAWRRELRNLAAELAVPLIELPLVYIHAELPYAFEDYCHPSARVHGQIAHQIISLLGL